MKADSLTSGQVKKRESLKSLSSFFSKTYFKKIIHGDTQNFKKRLQIHFVKVFNDDQLSSNYKLLIDKLYKKLEREYCNEYILKNTIINKLLETKNTTALNELRIGDSIADLVLANGVVKVFEIKTEFDSPKRLKSQLTDYAKVAQEIYIVTSYKKIGCYMEMYKDTNYGIYVFTEKNTLTLVKNATSDTTNFCHETLFKLLRKSEYLNIIKDVFSYIPNVPNTQIFKECFHLSKRIEVSIFQGLVFRELKRRRPNNESLIFSKDIPHQVRQLCYSLDIDKEEVGLLNEFLSSKPCISHT